MRGRIIEPADLGALIDLLRRDYEVIAPFCGRGRDSYFDVVTDENVNQIQIHLPNPYYPPKRFILPQIEPLLRIRGGQSYEPVYDETRRAIFGIRSCDVAAIYHLDRFYLDRTYKDIYYEKRRRNLLLINVVCTDLDRDIDEVCYCLCADTGPAARQHFDLQLMDLGDVYLAVAGTPQGEALFQYPLFKRGTPIHLEQRAQLLEEVRKRLKKTTSWFSAAIRYVTEGGISEQTWQEIGNRCLECGGCTYVCPACTCFTVTDRELPSGEVERVRLWDSCALSGYTRMAGGFNPRRAVHDRRNRRFFRKLAHYSIQRELSMACVGCGRCANVCHGDIGMPRVVEMLRRGSKVATNP